MASLTSFCPAQWRISGRGSACPAGYAGLVRSRTWATVRPRKRLRYLGNIALQGGRTLLVGVVPRGDGGERTGVPPHDRTVYCAPPSSSRAECRADGASAEAQRTSPAGRLNGLVASPPRMASRCATRRNASASSSVVEEGASPPGPVAPRTAGGVSRGG